MSQLSIVHRIRQPLGTAEKLDAVGECIYCRRKPPEVALTDEHIIADGFGGDLLLPQSSCVKCAKATGWVEQQMLRGMFNQPRGVMGIRSRKKRPKPASFTVNVAPMGEPPVLEEIPFSSGFPPLLPVLMGEREPGILTGRPPGEPSGMRLHFITPKDAGEQIDERWSKRMFGHKFKFHPGLFGQMIAKTCHAFAVACMGINGFEPFLTEFIRAREPPFDSYHLASVNVDGATKYLHEIWLESGSVLTHSAIGIGFRPVVVVKWRIFGQLEGPLLIAVVGRPISPAPAAQ